MRRPIAEYYKLEERADVVVGDDAWNAAEAGWNEDDGWVDLTHPEQPFATRLPFEPTWFALIPSREKPAGWLPIDTVPTTGAEVLVTDGNVVAAARVENGGWIYSTGGRVAWNGDDERGGAADLDLNMIGWLPLPRP